MRVFRERQGVRSARRRPRGTHRPGVARRRRSTLGLPSDALIELGLGCRLGVGVEVARPGIGHVPERWAPGGCDPCRLLWASNLRER